MKQQRFDPPALATLAEAGAALADVIELDTFHTDLQDDMRVFFKAKDEFFPSPYPAWTAVVGSGSSDRGATT